MEKWIRIDWEKEGRQIVRDYVLVVLGSLLLAAGLFCVHSILLLSKSVQYIYSITLEEIIKILCILNFQLKNFRVEKRCTLKIKN